MNCEQYRQSNGYFYFIYETTNLITGFVYRGKCQTKDSNLRRKYYGSGKYYKHAEKYYGKENFKREILCFCENLEELNRKEIELIAEIKDNGKCYNISKGGDGVSADVMYKFYENPLERQRVANQSKDRWIHNREKIINSQIQGWDKESKQNMSKKMKDHFSNPEERKKISKVVADMWKDPIKRAERIAAMNRNKST